MLAAGGEICIDVSGDDSTKTAQSPLIEPSCAVMVAFPGDIALTLPCVLTVATSDADEVQVTRPVIPCVLPSLQVPVAAQLAEVPGASRTFAGVTEIEARVAELTCSGEEPATPLKVAEMSAVPGPMAVAVFPPFRIATASLSAAQLESLVMTWVVLSLNKPVAVKAKLVPDAMVRPEGLTETRTIVAFVTSSAVEALMD